jgi:hypothetical protein
VRPATIIHDALPPMRLTNPKTGEHVGPCPFCAAGDNRFHVWTQASDNRPAWRFWCRNCGESGLVNVRFGDRDDKPRAERTESRSRVAGKYEQPVPNSQHIPQYRKLYELVMLWAYGWLLDESNPRPLEALAQRGVTATTARREMLGYSLNDTQSLLDHIRETAPDLFPYGEAAGIFVTDDYGVLRTHWNLCGALVFPYIAGGEVTDIRLRKLGEGQKTKSLPSSPTERGAVFPMGWDLLDGESDAILLTESGEYKTIIPNQEYHGGNLLLPTIGHPGLSNFRPEWTPLLIESGIKTVYMAYDSQPRRSNKQGLIELTPEEKQTIHVGHHLSAHGLEIRIIRLPLKPDQDKEDLDHFVLIHGAQRLQALIDEAPTLYDYHRSLPAGLLKRANLPPPMAYPSRSPRAHPIVAPTARPIEPGDDHDLVHEAIEAVAYQHAIRGQGFLVLAHSPVIGRRHTAQALERWNSDFARLDGKSHFLTWATLQKNQDINYNELKLILLHGRNAANCHEMPKSIELSKKGYSVREALCVRRCAFVERCVYLKQFDQQGDFSASQPLMQALRWWRDASVVVLDGFDPASLIHKATLSSSNLAAMARASTNEHVQMIIRWLMQIQASTADRTLSGVLLYQALDAEAERAGRRFGSTLAAAVAALPDPQVAAGIPGLSTTALLQEYEALPPGYLHRLLTTMEHEHLRRLRGARFSSRIEVRNGRLMLYLLQEHLRNQLARPDQPKIILDTHAGARLLRVLFPNTPIRVERTPSDGARRIIQVIGQDWANTTLHHTARRERWHEEVASHIRPGRSTLIVCTRECEEDLRRALGRRGLAASTRVAHYAALQSPRVGSGDDVILAQIYNPDLDELIREGRALFASDQTALDERIVLATQILTDAAGAAWEVNIPTFADERLAALLETRRENVMERAALHAQPIGNPESTITILASLPISGLRPTTIVEATYTHVGATVRGEAQ